MLERYVDTSDIVTKLEIGDGNVSVGVFRVSTSNVTIYNKSNGKSAVIANERLSLLECEEEVYDKGKIKIDETLNYYDVEEFLSIIKNTIQQK